MILISSCICLCPICWSRVLSREWRCSWSSADRRCFNCIWVINNLIAYKGAPYFRDLTVISINRLQIKNISTSCGIGLRWIPQNTFDGKLPLNQVRTFSEYFGEKYPRNIENLLYLARSTVVHESKTWNSPTYVSHCSTDSSSKHRLKPYYKPGTPSLTEIYWN